MQSPEAPCDARPLLASDAADCADPAAPVFPPAPWGAWQAAPAAWPRLAPPPPGPRRHALAAAALVVVLAFAGYELAYREPVIMSVGLQPRSFRGGPPFAWDAVRVDLNASSFALDLQIQVSVRNPNVYSVGVSLPDYEWQFLFGPVPNRSEPEPPHPGPAPPGMPQGIRPWGIKDHTFTGAVVREERAQPGAPYHVPARSFAMISLRAKLEYAASSPADPALATVLDRCGVLDGRMGLLAFNVLFRGLRGVRWFPFAGDGRAYLPCFMAPEEVARLRGGLGLPPLPAGWAPPLDVWVPRPGGGPAYAA